MDSPHSAVVATSTIRDHKAENEQSKLAPSAFNGRLIRIFHRGDTTPPSPTTRTPETHSPGPDTLTTSISTEEPLPPYSTLKISFGPSREDQRRSTPSPELRDGDQIVQPLRRVPSNELEWVVSDIVPSPFIVTMASVLTSLELFQG
ncbi:hypothetical protein FQN54_004409 [Arachnomyces sp. PD_36]|nr:hypothetical protein FQN54_004409 [Arachnomyces sp. PD_36]